MISTSQQDPVNDTQVGFPGFLLQQKIKTPCIADGIILHLSMQGVLIYGVSFSRLFFLHRLACDWRQWRQISLGFHIINTASILLGCDHPP